MEIVPFAKIGAEKWDKFCADSDDAWFRHTSACVDFSVALDERSKNLSFGIMEDKKLLAIVPLIKHPAIGDEKRFKFALGGDPVPLPAMRNDLSEVKREKLMKGVFKQIDEVAEKESVIYSRFFDDSLKEKIFPQSFFTNNFWCTTNATDLSLPEDGLLKNIRDTYRYDIRSAKNNGLLVFFYDKKNITDKIFGAYKNIYFSAAGHEVGTTVRWRATHELIKRGFAMLAIEKNRGGDNVGGIIIFVYKGRAYYAFGATVEEFKGVSGVGPLLQWEVIKYLKAKGILIYETGRNSYPNASESDCSPKDINISFFKSGFGGRIYSFALGEKFYDINYLKKRKVELVERYIEQHMKK